MTPDVLPESPTHEVATVEAPPPRDSDEVERLSRARWAKPVVAFEPILGLGTPVGWIGADVIVSPATWLATFAGVGLGSQGAQFAVGLRLPVRLGPGRWLGLGVGAALGPYVTPAIATVRRPPALYWDQARWIDAEVSYEEQVAGTTLRPFVGLAFLTNPDDGAKANVFAGRVPETPVAEFYTGFAIAFEIVGRRRAE